jgi:hypothetical protein
VEIESWTKQERLMAIQSDFESYLMNYEHEAMAIHAYLKKVGVRYI